jgi:starch synthase
VGLWQVNRGAIANQGIYHLQAAIRNQGQIKVVTTSKAEAPLNVVLFAAEAAPFAKVGGLADVVGALPKALAKLGVKPVIMIPAYRTVDFSSHQITPCAAVPAMDIRMGLNLEHAEIYQTRIQDPVIDVYLIGSSKYFDRDGIYDDPLTGEGYPDNMERFVFFMKSGIELLRRLHRPLDVLHCHDSHTALIPGMIKLNYRDDPMLSRAGTLLTIHNLAHQGLFPKESLEYAGIDLRHFYPLSPFEYWGRVNFMKAGIELADKVNTVSHTYSVEVRTDPEFGMGLENVLQRRGEDVSGIMNGIDYDEWDPERDPLIPFPFSLRDLSGKSQCKEWLLKYFGFPCSGDRIPLLGIVSRLADQKGLDLIAEAVEEITALDLRLVILGMGQKKYHDLFTEIASRHPEKVGVRLVFDNKLAHQIEAGCDFFLMPSKFEPCGLNQLYSLRYGTIPIVRAIGGLADTVVDYNRGEGTGFRFVEYKSGEMVDAIKRALAVYSNPAQWRELVIRAMAQDWSWDRSAAEYLSLYKTIKNHGRP